MAPPADAAEMADLITRLGLAEEFTCRECLYDLDSAHAPADDLVRMMERKRILTPYQTSKLVRGDLDGYFMGGYRLLYHIAAGSFGRVYRGDDPRTGESVAVKVLRRRWTEDKRKIELFEREGRVGLSLQHPNIVRILAVSKDPSTGSFFLVMEFIEGGNLRDILNIRKKMSPEEGLKIMEECADGLTFAVSRGLSHRDIKPTNILLGTDGVAKLVDFGLAEINNSMQEAAVAVPAKGKGKGKEEETAVDRTVDYAGLEKATGVKQGDGRSDLYFLGHVLFEMVAGEPLMPPTKDKHARMASRRFELVEETLAARASALELPRPLVNLIAKAVAFDPMRRFQSPGQFLDAIRATRAEMAGGSHAGGPIRPSGPLTIFVVEANQKLQDVFREKFKRLGFRVLISADPVQALKRYQQQAYHAVLIDAGSAPNARAAVDAFGEILKFARENRLETAGVLVVNEDQQAWADEYEGSLTAAAFARPVTMNQITKALRDLVPELASHASGPQSGNAEM